MPASTSLRTLARPGAPWLLALVCATGWPAAASTDAPSPPVAGVPEASLTPDAPPPAAGAPADATPNAATSPDFVALMLRKGGESCFFGAGTGAASILLSSIQMPTTGLAAPGLFGLALGAASFGCAVGFVGATAASGFSYFWEQSVETPPRGPAAPPAPTGGPAPEMTVPRLP